MSMLKQYIVQPYLQHKTWLSSAGDKCALKLKHNCGVKVASHRTKNTGGYEPVTKHHEPGSLPASVCVMTMVKLKGTNASFYYQ